jgi:hypothetical protein
MGCGVLPLRERRDWALSGQTALGFRLNLPDTQRRPFSDFSFRALSFQKGLFERKTVSIAAKRTI